MALLVLTQFNIMLDYGLQLFVCVVCECICMVASVCVWLYKAFPELPLFDMEMLFNDYG